MQIFFERARTGEGDALPLFYSDGLQESEAHVWLHETGVHVKVTELVGKLQSVFSLETVISQASGDRPRKYDNVCSFLSLLWQ